MSRAAAMASLILVVGACGDEVGSIDSAVVADAGARSADGAAPADASPPMDALPDGITPSPDGLGYCCPPLVNECPYMFYPGGFVASVSVRCPARTDVATSPMTPLATDAHGCTYWDWQFSNVVNCLGP